MRVLFPVVLFVAMLHSAAACAKTQSETIKMLDLFGDVFDKVKSDYVEDVSDKDLIEAAINGMLSSLDPHSSYLNEEDFQEMQIQTSGKFGGLGIEVTMDKGLVKVVAPIDDTPAAKAGLQSGDYISKIDGDPVMGITLREAVDKMRGEPGTDITLEILREAEANPFDVTITRAIIKIESVRHKVIDGDVGYFRVTAFSEQTSSLLERKIEDVKKIMKKEGMEGAIIDLRNNPGGLLDQAIEVSDLFLDKGEIVSTGGRIAESNKRFNAKRGDILDGKPVVVLINGGSASASEIVAGALQDHKRAIITGTRSFGKGSVQTVLPLSASNGAMRLTTSRYYTPSGRSIQAQGIEPDILVEQSKIESLNKEGVPTESSLPKHLQSDDEKNGKQKKEPKPEKGKGQDTGMKEKEDKEEKEKEKKEADGASLTTKEIYETDYQLGRAADLVHAIHLYEHREK
jgi:carboxyl-terminal processing protease